MMEKNLKKINVPFFGKDSEVLMSIEEIRKSYLTEFEIIKSELSSENVEFIENGITKTGIYISGVDIFLEKRKEFINELLFEKLKLIFGKNEEIFPNINYNYWMNMNPFYADAPLLPTMKICLINFASLPGLINDVIEDIENMTCKTLVSLIENDIKEIIKKF